MFLKKLPTTIELRAICETWQLQYEKVQQSRITTKQIEPYHLRIRSHSMAKKIIIPTIEHWIKNRAKKHLINWVSAISEEMHLPFRSVTIRGQRARWGSCSEHRDLSLNYKLLFLPASLVDYILVHELCHLVHLNHSRDFWNLVATHEPNYREKRKALYHCHQYLPTWTS